ncbi:MAG: hypothetical protein RLZZ214_2964 [Verrucomicrobiota bacterium]
MLLSIHRSYARFRDVKLTQYHPSIRRLQEDFAAHIARRKHIAARGPRPPKGKIMDNSEPWLAKPDSDDWYIACKVNERVKAWKHLLTISSVP